MGGDAIAGALDGGGDFVAENSRELDERIFAAKCGEVAATKSHETYAQQDFAGPHFGRRDFAKRPRTGGVKIQRFHAGLFSMLASVFIGFGVFC
jgi:hypothetical protein